MTKDAPTIHKLQSTDYGEARREASNFMVMHGLTRAVFVEVISNRLELEGDFATMEGTRAVKRYEVHV